MTFRYTCDYVHSYTYVPLKEGPFTRKEKKHGFTESAASSVYVWHLKIKFVLCYIVKK